MKRFLLFLPAFFHLACQKPLPPQATWAGSIILAEQRKLPIQMALDLRKIPYSGYFLVGHDRTPIPEIRLGVSGFLGAESLNVVFSEYAAEMRGIWDGSTWTGQFIRYRKDTVYLDFSLSPSPPAPAEMPPPQAGAVRLVGTFQVYFDIPDGTDSTNVATFWAKGDSVYGTFIDPSGDHGLMAGVQTGAQAWLGRFTGWQANLIELEQKEGQWSGRYYARQFPPQSFRLKARPSLPSRSLGVRETRMKNPSVPFFFNGITADGDTISNLNPWYAGKALIIDIMGTWCHNCLDEAPLLQQVYSDFKDKGLEIVGLSFEVTNDTSTAKKNLDIYRKRHQLTFPLLFCGSLDPENVQAKIHDQLKDFFAYPTTIFVDRKGRVRHIHMGFKGPGTGEEYQREIELFYKYVRQLVEE